VHQFVPGSGEGQHTSTVCDARRLYWSWSRRPITRAGAGNGAYGLLGGRRRTEGSMAERCRQADPLVTQFGHRLAHAAPSRVEKLIPIERRIALEQVIHRPCLCMGQDGQRVPLAMVFL